MFKTIEDVEQFFSKRKNLGIQLGLDRIKALLNKLEHPEKQLTVIHVAGTNGKGSTTNFMNHALVANGYQVGMFTSPSFTGLTGHILLNGKQITNTDFIQLFREVYPAISHLDQNGIYATEFEIITAMALYYFARHAHIAIIEAGMGGRYDTTNCLVPILSIITNVDNDHTGFLGETLAEIASHKAGIIKEETPTIIGPINDQAYRVIAREAARKLAPLYRFAQEFTYEMIEQPTHSQQFVWKYKDITKRIHISMLGEHQVVNCSIAMMALELIEDKGFVLHPDKTAAGLSKAVLPGRFEIITRNKQTIILDSAHNVASMQAFVKTMNTYFSSIKNKHLVFSAFQDKEVENMLKVLMPHFSTIVLTTFQHPRAMTMTSLQTIIKKTKQSIKIKDLSKVIHQLNQRQEQDEGYYFFTGSLHFIAYLRGFFTNE